MKPQGIEYLTIDKVDDFITNIDTADLASNFGLRTRGFRHIKPGTIGERDWGTIHRYQNYPVSTLSDTSINIVNGFSLNIPTENKNYEVVFGYDANTNLHIYVDDTSAKGNWTELTEFITATVSSISGVTAVITNIKDQWGTTIGAMTANYLQEFIAFVPNQTNSAGLVTANTSLGGGNVTITLVNKPDVALSWGASSSVILYRNTATLPSSVIGTGRGFNPALGKTPHLRFLDITAQNKLNVFYGDSGSPPTTYQPLQIRKGGMLSPGSFTIGGSTTGWSVFASPTSSIDIKSVWTITASGTKYVWITVGTAIYSCNDQGTGTWTAWTSNTITNGNTLFGIVFIDKDHGFACGLGGVVYKTTNGSNVTPSWSSITTGTIGTTDLYGVTALDANNVWVAGSGGNIYKTANAGTSWTAQSLSGGITSKIYCIQMLDSNNGWCGSEFPGGVGTTQILFKTTNGGTTWSKTGPNFGPIQAITSLSFTSTTLGFMCGTSNGNPNFSYTTADGTNWTPLGAVAGLSVSMIDSSDIRFSGVAAATWYSSNGGSSFALDTVPVTSSSILAQSYYSPTSGFAVGTKGFIMLLAGSPGVAPTGAFTGWHTEKWGMLPDFVSIGSQATPIGTGSGTVTQTIGEGIRMSVSVSEETISTGQQFYVRMIVTALYADYTGTQNYQESEPIAQIFISSSGVNKFPRGVITMYLDMAIINKNFYGFRFYEATNDVQVLANSRWLDDFSTYIQAYQLRPDTIGWGIDTTQQYAYSNQVNQFTYALYTTAVGGGAPSLLSNLGHVPILTRTSLTPRYAAKVSREQGTLVAVDQDNQTIRLAAYSGAGVLMDDSFPNVSVDNNANKLIQYTSGRGEMLGIAILREMLIVLYPSEKFTYDFISQQPSLETIDCVSKRSITGVGMVDAPIGIAWAGKSGLYFLPRDGSGIKILNLNFLNLYDGSLLTTDKTTPFVNDTFRSMVISGYEPTYHELWFMLPCAVETPNLATITAATNATPIVLTVPNNLFKTNDLVYVQGVLGNTAANGLWLVTVSGNSVTLVGSTGNGAYTSGGTCFNAEYLIFRYNTDFNKFSVRKVAIGTGGNMQPTYFSRRLDNTMTIGYNKGLLMYPYRDLSGKPYEDDVLITTDSGGNITSVTSQGHGIDTLLRLNLGALYNLESNSVIYEIINDFSGTSIGDGDRLQFDIFAKGSDVPVIPSMYINVGFKSSPITIDSTIGAFEKAQIQFSLPKTSLTNFLRLEIKKIQIGIVKKTRIGRN